MAKTDKSPIDIEALEQRVGTVLKDKWTIERLIGVGGTAAVYEARHEIGRRDALKILHSDFVSDDTLVARFRREAEAVNRIDHAGVTEVRDIGVTEDGEPFLVMELLEGESVFRILRRDDKLELELALELTDQLLDILIAAHDQDVIHRDIKPSNLFVDAEGRLRVLDFGVARVLLPTGKALTEAGTTLGTLAYMPPEQLKRSDVDHRADLYAVGATLHEMLTGEWVHKALSRQELATIILTEPAKTLLGAQDDVPDDLAKVVDRALAFLPERRYPDAATMQADLRAVREGETPSYAAGRLDAGDDPRDKEPPEDEPATKRSDEPEAETPSTPSPVLADGGTERMVVADDEATTRKRPIVDDDATTHVRETADSEPPAAPEATDRSADEADEDEPPAAPKGADRSAEEPDEDEPPAAPKGADRSADEAAGDKPPPYWLLAVIALGAAVLWWVTRSDHDAAEPPTTAVPSATASPATAPSESVGAGGAPPAAEVAPSASDSAPDDDLPVEKPPAKPGGKPSPRPGASGEPGKSDGGLPFPFPTGLPTSFPTSIPTSLPSGFPFPLPSAAPPATKSSS